jgi:hypothetical protein
MNDFWKFCTRMGIVGLLVCFGIFYGVDLAANGLHETGARSISVNPAASDEQAVRDADQLADGSGNLSPGLFPDAGQYPYQSPYDPMTYAQEPTLVSVLADVTGDVLQRTARGGIELIVSLFDGILH